MILWYIDDLATEDLAKAISSVAILGVCRGGDDDDNEDGDMGEVTSILITAEMELSIISTIVSRVDSILEKRRWGQHIKAVKVWDGGEQIEQKCQHTDGGTKDDILKKANKKVLGSFGLTGGPFFTRFSMTSQSLLYTLHSGGSMLHSLVRFPRSHQGCRTLQGEHLIL